MEYDPTFVAHTFNSNRGPSQKILKCVPDHHSDTNYSITAVHREIHSCIPSIETMSDEEEDANVQQLDCCGGTYIAGFFHWILQYNPFSTALRGQEGIVEGFTFDGNPGHEEDDAIMEPPSPSLPKRGESYSVEVRIFLFALPICY